MVRRGRLRHKTPSIDNYNPSTGAVSPTSFGSQITLGGSDLEGVAYNAANNSIYVSDETGPTIKEYNLSGSLLNTVSVPSVYSNYRTNLSLESLSLQNNHQSLWTANEQALNGDDHESSTSSGTTVRIQKFDSNLNPAGQWAYQTHAITNSFPSVSDEQNGVADIAVLPNGKVLVLEREADAYLDFLDPTLQYRNRIYEVDFTGATDVSFIPSLDGVSYSAVQKRLLWDHTSYASNRNNFEGMALGPQLDNGDYSLLLISDGDNSGGYSHLESLYALRLSGTVPEPRQP